MASLGLGRGAVERSNGAQPPVGASPGQDNRTAQAEPDGADPVTVHLGMPCHLPERGLQGGNAVVVEVSGHPADEHPGHARRAVAAFEQVHSQRRVTFCGEPAADAADVVVEPGGLIDDDTGIRRRRAVRQRQRCRGIRFSSLQSRPLPPAPPCPSVLFGRDDGPAILRPGRVHCPIRVLVLSVFAGAKFPGSGHRVQGQCHLECPAIGVA